MLLQPGLTCWRVETADRVAFLIDNSTYFTCAKAVMSKARRSIHLLGWAFDPLTQLQPDTTGGGPPGDRIGDFLKRLAVDRPDLDVRVLIWKSSLPISASQHFFPHRARRCFQGTPVKFALDASVPLGACHHQKVLVVDDRIAFCGGGDISVDRFDTIKHRDVDGRRIMPWGKPHAPRHEVMALMEGPVAAALGELARDRWERAEGERPPPPAAATSSGPSYWPAQAGIDFEGVKVAIARTQPGWRGGPKVRESERLHLAAIAAARRLIYLENQYVTSPIYAEALADRLEDPEGPEVVIVSTSRAPSWFDHMTMDRTRSMFLKRLKASDLHGRLHAYCPYTRKGTAGIIIHSKVTIVDDVLLRAGSTNLNNRSAGFDTECDVAVEARTAEQRRLIRGFRARLVAHYLDCRPEAFEAAFERLGGLAAAIDALDTGALRRLRPLEPAAHGPVATVIAAFHLGDPADPADSWRPWRRKADIEAERRAFLEDLRRAPGRRRVSGPQASAAAHPEVGDERQMV